MSVISGLPAHVLLVHFMVAFTVLVSVLLMICSVWNAALNRLIWLVSGLSISILLLTWPTIHAGQWLASKVTHCDSDILEKHESAGQNSWWMTGAILFATALLVHLYKTQSNQRVPLWLNRGFVLIIWILSLWVMYRIYYIGDAGARAAWS